MTLRKWFLASASVIANILLLKELLRVSHLESKEVLSQLRIVDWTAFANLSLLMALSTYLSSRKWQLLDTVIRRSTDRVQSQFSSFTLTALGVALGQVLPVQVAVSMTRTMGTWVFGSGLRRGTLSTLIEQASDVLIVCLLAAASAGTFLLGGGALMWLGCAATMATLAVVAVPALLKTVRKLASNLTDNQSRAASWVRAVAALTGSGLVDARLARQLIGLSLLRFAVLVLMAGQTTRAIHASIPLWHLAAAMPIVVLSAALGFAPGGLGVTEFSYCAMLKLFGTTLSNATQWAFANRLLTCMSAFAIALVVTPLFLLWRTMRRSENNGTQLVTADSAHSFLPR